MSEKSKLTTLCHVERDGKYLMMHRVKKENDLNKDKWVGIGGHFEDGESPEDCLVREAKEETGLILTKYHLDGIVTFVSDVWGTEYMFLYTATEFIDEAKENAETDSKDEAKENAETDSKDEAKESEKTDDKCLDSRMSDSERTDDLILKECNEGTLEWVDKKAIYDLPIWEGDKIFFRLLEEKRAFFSLKLRYVGDTLVEAVLDGEKITDYTRYGIHHS